MGKSSNRASQVALVVRNLLAKAADIRNMDLTPGSGRALGGGHGNPLQYSCLKNPTNRGAWWATVPGVSKSWTRLKGLSLNTSDRISPLICVFIDAYTQKCSNK